MFTSLKIYTSLAILLSIYFFATYPPADSFVIIHHCLFGFECNDMHFLFRCFLKWPVALNHSSFETLMWIPNMISWMVLIIILSFKTSPTCRTEKKNSALLILPRWRRNLDALVIFFQNSYKLFILWYTLFVLKNCFTMNLRINCSKCL